MTTLTNVAHYSYYTLLIFNIALAAFNLRRRKTSWIGFICVYLIGLLLVQLTADILGWYGMNNHFISHIFFNFQFLLIGLLYIHIFRKHKRQKVFVKLYLIVIYCIFILYYLISPSAWFGFNLLEIILTNYLMIICPLMYLYNTLSKKRYLIFLNTGILCYGTLSSSIMIYINIMISVDFEQMAFLWTLNYVIALFFHLMITLQLLHSKSFSKLFLKWKKN